MKTVLTGIKATGMPHLGNYLGAIRPAIKSVDGNNRCLFFIADYHALTSIRDPKLFKEYAYEGAAVWLALGLDPDKAIFYKQSDIPEIFELTWILSCLTSKGDMNRAHSYKDKVQKNIDKGVDPDKDINMGLYNYPVLMSADILLFDTDSVPVGKDQVQHIEIARSIASRVNEIFGEGTLKEPQENIQSGELILGLDGRKMSKSYDNSIPLFTTEKKLKKLINKITTDSSAPEEPKDPDNSQIMDLYKLFAKPEEISSLSKRYQEGIGWGHAKLELFEVVNRELKDSRAEFEKLIQDKTYLDEVLKKGADKARAIGTKVLDRVKKQVTGF